MRKFLTAVMLLLCSATFAQEKLTGAMGLDFGISKEQAMEVMSKKAGFEFYREMAVGKTISYTNGIFAGRQCVGAVLHFHENKLHTIVILLESKPEAKTVDLYDEVVGDLQVRYNLIPKQYHQFKSPYEAGDGYTVSAIRLGYADLTTLFAFGDSNVISVNITQACSIKLTYQHTVLAEPAINQQNSERTKDY